ncbi:MAG: citrate lyase subunit alpha [Erysipelotrichaceae bacterium]|nr:citrate lyase subunit alpha [Erysipelotrichaceae bacterium]
MRYEPKLPYQYIESYEPRTYQENKTSRVNHEVRKVEDMDQLFDMIQLKDGMTISFHHHLRNGDAVMNLIMDEIIKRNLRDITVAASSVFPIHTSLATAIERGVVTQVVAAYMSGAVADVVSKGKCLYPCVMQTHGGRALSIESGKLKIDVAFIASPAMDKSGNISGRQGKAACGSLGYAIADAHYAEMVVAITDTIEPLNAFDIPKECVDVMLHVDSIGDPKGIVSGTTRITKDPVGLAIAKRTIELMDAVGYIKDGLSFQTGAGGISLAVAAQLHQKLSQNKIKGSFASGGITGYLVDMFEEGLFEKLYDVQCFDLAAVASIQKNENHFAISASQYGNPYNPKNIVDQLDVVILGASEIDLNFNVNVTTGFDHRILGGSGGHADTAFGSKFAIIVSKLVSSRISVVVDQVTTITTPGQTIDALVTDYGIAIHPRHSELIEQLKKTTRLSVVSMKELLDTANELCGLPQSVLPQEKIVALMEYRDLSVIDVIRQSEIPL